MFHLFNDVYVESELFLDPTVTRANLSQVTGLEYVVPATDVTDGGQIAFAKSLNELGEDGFLSLMQDLAVQKDKVYIYADSESYNRLYAIMLKALFPQITYNDFAFFYVCKKAVVDSRSATSYRPKKDPLNGVRINTQVVKEMYANDDSMFIPAMLDVLDNDDVMLSLEWAILQLVVNQRVDSVPRRLKNILKRTVLGVVHETLGSIGLAVTDRSRWEYLGCDLDTLLGSDSIFQGCTNLGHLNNSIFVGQSSLKTQVPDSWLMDLLQQLIVLLGIYGEFKTVKYCEGILELFQKGFVNLTAEQAIEYLNQVFIGGERTVSLPHHDLGKYDENLIRHILRSPVSEMHTLMKGSKW